MATETISQAPLQDVLDRGIGGDIGGLVALPIFYDLLIVVIFFGLVSMVLVQVLKAIPTIGRASFQKRFIRRWLARQIRLMPAPYRLSKDVEAIAKELEWLALPGANDASFLLSYEIYHLPRENLVGQLNSAVQIIVEEPTRYRDLFYVFCHSAGEATLRAAMERPAEGRLIASATEFEGMMREDQPLRELARALRAAVEAGDREAIGMVVASMDDAVRDLPGSFPEISQTVNRIKAQVAERELELRTVSAALNLANAQAQRSLDGIQVEMGRRWQRLLTIESISIGILSFGGLRFVDYYIKNNQSLAGLTVWDWVFWAVIGLVGGYLGTAVRDFLSMLEGTRRRPT